MRRPGFLPPVPLSRPANEREPDAVEQLAVLAEKIGLPLIELAVACVINHPASPRQSSRLVGQVRPCRGEHR